MEYHYVPSSVLYSVWTEKKDYNIASALSAHLNLRKQNIKWAILVHENISGILHGLL